MQNWSKESCLVFGIVVLLIGLEFMTIQQLVLTKEVTVFVARQTNHPSLAAAQTLEQITGADAHVKPLHMSVWAWFGRIVALAGTVLIVRNAGRDS